MNSFSDISKTNYLELDNDIAKPTNDLIKEEQALWDRHFQIAIEEAGRLEKVKDAQQRQLLNLIGQGAQFAQKLKKWEETKDWQRLAEYENTGKIKDPAVQKRLDKLEKERNEITKQTEESEIPLNDAILTTAEDPTDKESLSPEATSLAVKYKYSTALAITKNKRIAAKYVADKFSDFSLKIYNNTTNPFKQPDGSPDSIAAAVNRADWDRVQDLRRYYNNVFLNLSQLDGIPDSILKEQVYSKINDHWNKQLNQFKQEEAKKSLKIAEKIEFQNFFTCMDGDDKIGCLVGTKDSIGFIKKFEMRNGVKNTPLAWEYAFQAIEEGLKNKSLDWTDIKQMLSPDQTFKPRGGGKEDVLENINKKYYDRLYGLMRTYEDKAFQEEQRENEIAIKAGIDSYIGKEGIFTETIDTGGYVGEEDVLNAAEKLKQDFRAQNIEFTEQDLQPLLNYFTWEDQDDSVIVRELNKQMLDNPGRKIHNWRAQVNQIKDVELRKKTVEELKKHHEIEKDILDDFTQDFNAVLVTKYPSQINTSARNSSQWITEQRNAEEYFKDKYRELINTPGLTEDPYEAALKDTAQKHAEGKFDMRETPKKDVEFEKSLESVKAHVESAGVKEVLNQETYWAGEKEAGIVPGLDYKSGELNDRAVDYYLSLQRLFPTLTWYELMNKRMEVLGIKDKETAGKVKTEAFVIPEREHAEELGPDGHLLINSNKNTPNRTYRVLINPQNTEWMLDTIQVSSNPNNIQNWPGPAILRPNLKLEDTPLNRVSAMVMDTNMKVGLYGLTHRSFKTLEEAGVLDYYRDTPFDAETQKELMVHLAKLNSNKQNLSTLSGGYKRLMSIPKETLDEFNALDEDNLNISLFNQIDNLIPAAADVIIKEGYQPTPQESWERTGIYKTYDWLRNLGGPPREETDEIPTPYTGGGL